MNHLGSVVAAYMFIWGILIFYQFTVSRRLATLREEAEQLKVNIKGNPRS